jgi:phosphohistidine phosphatase
LASNKGPSVLTRRLERSIDLYLVRHAVAFRRDPDRWPRGSRRPLTPEGEEEFRLAVRGLARIVPRVDVILSSPNQRTWHTAEILAELDSWPAPEPSPALRTGSRRGSPEKASLALEDYADAKSVAVVGHKPRLQELAAYLLTGKGDAMEIKIRQGSVTCICFDGAPAPGTGKLRWLLTPEALRFLAGQHFS